MGTLFTDVYDRFFGKITDDMYLEYTPRDTLRDLRQLLIDSIPGFEFPRKRLDFVLDYDVLSDNPDHDGVFYWNEIPETHLLNAAVEDGLVELTPGSEMWNPTEEDGVIPEGVQIVDTSHFEEDLTSEEINILALMMKAAWIQRQVASIENTRMKYSGADFKMTSQANHLSKLLNLLTEAQREAFHFQRLYKRRKVDEDGYIKSNWSVLREVSALDY